MSEEQWKEIETEVWVPENKDDSISGVYLGVEPKVGENKSKLYTLETEPGKQLKFWGSRVLDGKMMAAKVGQQVKILFLGMEKPSGGREYKDYKVFYQLNPKD